MRELRRVFKAAVPEGYEWALPIEDSDYQVFETFGRPQDHGWRPIRMEILKEDELGRRLRQADLPWLGEHVLLLRPNAYALLRDICLRFGELLPLWCEDGELFAWNATTTVEALDVARSDVVRFPSSGRIMKIKKHAFHADRVADLQAFRVPEVRTIFFGQDLVERIRSAGLTGTTFREVWHAE